MSTIPTPARKDAAGTGRAPGGLVLLYHRIIPLESDPQLMAVRPRHFFQHLEVLRKTAVPMALREMVSRAAEGTLPPRAVAVTFDDGYRDNLVFARPLLEQADVPGTVFVASGYLDGRREFWWDAMERIFLRPGRLPETWQLSLGGQDRRWELNGSSTYSEADYHDRAHWSVLLPNEAGGRQRLYMELCELLRPLGDEVREQVLEELSSWSGVPRSPRATARPLTPEEIVLLTEDGLVEVGAHTATHSVLSTLTPDQQRQELMVGKGRLEEILGRPVTTFSYPFGTRKDYTADTARLTREAGFELACSNFRGVVRSGTDAFQLPRVIVRDCDGDAFARQLEEEFSRA
jgi:peptidoglycan/xylan/chitin deacetylase (PgdA/CDA1 family)